MTIYSLDVLLSLFGTSLLSMSSSNCCFLTCIQISQETGKVVWYFHLFKNFPQFVVIHTVKGRRQQHPTPVFLGFPCSSLRNLYAGQEATVTTGHGTTDCSKSGKEYIKAVYCHPAYLTYIQNTSHKMLGWMKHKLESRLLREISITSDMQTTPPLWPKAKN